MSRTLTVLVGVALSLLLIFAGVARRASADANAATALGTGPGGTLWLAENQRPYLARVDLSGLLHPARLPTAYSFPVSIVTGPDGALWVADEGAGASNLLRYPSSGSGAPIAYPLPDGAAPSVVTVGPDHALWFTDRRLSAIGRMTMAGRVTMYPLPTRNAVPDYIVAGPDGALWFTETQAHKIGRIDMRGRITERAAYVARGQDTFAAPDGVHSAYPTGIVAGPDGNLWFTEQQGFLVRLSTAWRQTPYLLPGKSFPSQVVVGADKSLWIANADGIVRADTSGHMTLFPVGANALVVAVAVASDGSVWFSDETGKDVLGRIAHGRVTGFPAPPVSI